MGKHSVANVETDEADTDDRPRYPYFQNSAIENAANVFWQSVQDTRDAVNRVSPGKWVWVTETGWPISGPNSGAAVSSPNKIAKNSHTEQMTDFRNQVASVQNAQTFWRSVACKAFNEIHIFWYSYQDYHQSPSFGIFGQDGNAIYDLYGC